MVNRLFVLVIVLTLAACAVPPGGYKRGLSSGLLGGGGSRIEVSPQAVQPPPQYFVDETVEVLTEPAGARIHVNDAFVGYSPLKAPVRRLWRGDPRYPMTLDTVKIEAIPVAGGQCVQSGIFGQNSGRTPPQVSFNMTACAAAAPAAPVQSAPEPAKQ